MIEQKGMFNEFVGKKIKAPYLDGKEFKIARGTLVEANNGFIKVSGDKGTLIINEKNIEKMSGQG